MDNNQLLNLLHIQEASKHDRLVIFVGAGVSKSSGIYSSYNLVDMEWIELLSAEIEEKILSREVYKEKLKDNIIKHKLTKERKEFLLRFL